MFADFSLYLNFLIEKRSATCSTYKCGIQQIVMKAYIKMLIPRVGKICPRMDNNDSVNHGFCQFHSDVVINAFRITGNARERNPSTKSQ